MNEKDNINSQESEKDKWNFSDFVSEFNFFTFLLFIFLLVFIGYSNKQLELKHQEVKAETFNVINQCTDSYYEIYYVEVLEVGWFDRDVAMNLVTTFNGTNENLEKVTESGYTIPEYIVVQQIIYETLKDYCSLEYTEMRFNELQNFYKEQQNSLKFKLTNIWRTFWDLGLDLGRDLGN